MNKLTAFLLGLCLVTATGARAAIDLTDFDLTHPFQIVRVNSVFYYHLGIPWRDSTFRFKIYAGDGQTLLYRSDPIEAVAGRPGPRVCRSQAAPSPRWAGRCIHRRSRAFCGG